MLKCLLIFYKHFAKSNLPEFCWIFAEFLLNFCLILTQFNTPRRNKRTFRSLLFHVNGPGTRCSLFSRIFSTFPETTLLASAFGGLRESHPLSLHPRARFFLKRKKKNNRSNKKVFRPESPAVRAVRCFETENVLYRHDLRQVYWLTADFTQTSRPNRASVALQNSF